MDSTKIQEIEQKLLNYLDLPLNWRADAGVYKQYKWVEEVLEVMEDSVEVDKEIDRIQEEKEDYIREIGALEHTVEGLERIIADLETELEELKYE